MNDMQKKNYWKTLKKTPIQVAGFAGYQLHTESLSPEKGNVAYYAIRTYVKNEDNVYEIILHAATQEELIEKENVYNRMVSTFRFLSLTPTTQPETQPNAIYCCDITYVCPDNSQRKAFVQNHSAHRFKMNKSTCKKIGIGAPSMDVYSDENCTELVNPYIDYCNPL
jgi:hypothetical protein